MAIPPPPADPSQLQIPPPPMDPSMLGKDPSMLGMAGQAIGQTLSQDLPGVGPVVGAMRGTLPNVLQTLSNAAGMPNNPFPGMIRGVGEALPKTGGDLALQGLAGPLTEAGGAIAAPIARKLVPSIVEAVTRFESTIVERAIARVSQVGRKMEGTALTDASEQAVGKLKEAVKGALSSVGKRMGSVEDAVAARSDKLVTTGDIAEKFSTNLAKAGYEVPGVRAGEVTQKLNGKTKDILADLNKRKLSFKDTLNLRRKIDDAVEFAKKGSLEVGTVEGTLLKQARKDINDRLLAIDPTFKKANDAYARVRQSYDLLHDEIFSGKDETINRRIAAIFKKGTAERKLIQRLDQVGGNTAAALDDLLDTITAQKFQPKVHPSISKAFFNTGGGPIANTAKLLMGEGAGAAVGHPGMAPLLAGATVGISSPKLNFRVIQASKQIASILSKLGLGGSKVVATLSAPAIHDAIIDHVMDQHLNAPIDSNP